MDIILKELKANPYLRLISNISKNYPAGIYLVGGYLRDLFLRRKIASLSRLPVKVKDFDFAVSRGAIPLSREIAARLKSPFVVLDKEHGSSRIVYKKNGLCSNFDFTDFRGKDIFEDLLHRDFTINSMAINLKAIKEARDIQTILLDSQNAKKDIKAGIIRIVSDYSLPEDPLRILRAFSLSAVLDFKIEAKTKIAIKKYKERLSACAFERIAEELFKILNSNYGFRTFKAMDIFGVLDEVVSEIRVTRKVNQGPYHHLDVYGHSLETLKQIEILFLELKRNKGIQGYLDETISGIHTRRALLKLGAFLHDIGKPASRKRIKGKTCFHGHERVGRNIARIISERLRLSNEESNALDRMIFWHLRPGYMADIKNLSKRAVYRYFKDTQVEAAAVLLLSIADQRSTRGPLTKGANRKHHEDVCLSLIKEFFSRSKKKELPRLINGYDVMRQGRILPGPLIGKILSKVEEAQAIGEVKTKSQALALANKIIKGEKKLC